MRNIRTFIVGKKTIDWQDMFFPFRASKKIIFPLRKLIGRKNGKVIKISLTFTFSSGLQTARPSAEEDIVPINHS